MRSRSRVFWLYGLLFLLIFAAAFFLSSGLRLVDSEIWSFYLAKNWNPFENSLRGFFWKPLQGLILRILAIFSSDRDSLTQFLDLGRSFWTLLFAIQLIFLVRIGLRLHFSNSAMIFGGGLLLLSRYYLVESLRVRADSLAVLFLLVLVWELIREFQHVSDGKFSSTSLAIAAFFAVFSSIKFLPQVILLLAMGAIFFKDQRRKIVDAALKDTVFVCVLLGALLIPSGPRHALLGVLRSLFEAGTSFAEYRENLIFVKDQIFFLSPFWLVSAFLFFRSIKDPEAEGRIDSFLASFALLNSLVVLCHPEPFPWYVATSIPFHLFCLLRILRPYERFLRRAWILGILLMVLGFGNAFQNFRGRERQQRAIDDLALLKEIFSPKTYYDNCGLISDVRHSIPFITANQGTDTENAIRMFRANPPDLVVQTARTLLILPTLAPILDAMYVRDDADKGIWIRKSLLDSEELKRKLAPRDPREVFKNFSWSESTKFETLFSPYLGYLYL